MRKKLGAVDYYGNDFDSTLLKVAVNDFIIEVLRNDQQGLDCFQSFSGHLPGFEGILSLSPSQAGGEICRALQITLSQIGNDELNNIYREKRKSKLKELVSVIKDLKEEILVLQRLEIMKLFIDQHKSHGRGKIQFPSIKKFMINGEEVGKKIYQYYRYKYGEDAVYSFERDLPESYQGYIKLKKIISKDKQKKHTALLANAGLADYLSTLNDGDSWTGGTLAKYEKIPGDKLGHTVRAYFIRTYGNRDYHNYFKNYISELELKKHPFIKRINRTNEDFKKQLLVFLKTVKDGELRTIQQLNAFGTNDDQNYGSNLLHSLQNKYGKFWYLHLPTLIGKEILDSKKFSTKFLEKSPYILLQEVGFFAEHIKGKKRSTIDLQRFGIPQYETLGNNLYAYFRSNFGERWLSEMQKYTAHNITVFYEKYWENKEDSDIADSILAFFDTLNVGDTWTPIDVRNFSGSNEKNHSKNLEALLYRKLGKGWFFMLNKYVDETLLAKYNLVYKIPHTKESISDIIDEVFDFIEERSLTHWSPNLLQKRFKKLYSWIQRKYITDEGISWLSFLIEHIDASRLEKVPFTYYGRNYLAGDVISRKRSKDIAEINLGRGISSDDESALDKIIKTESLELLQGAIQSLCEEDKIILNKFYTGEINTNDDELGRIIRYLKKYF